MPLLLILAALGFQDPVRVAASLAQDRIETGQTTVLRVEVETDGPRAQIERLTRLPPGVELVSTRDFDQRQFRVPGGTRRFISREYVLRARTAGQYRIPAVDIVVENQRFSTSSLLLTVTASRVAPPEGGATGEGNVVLRAWLEQDTVYVGEQVNFRVEAMFSQEARLRLRRAPEYEAPRPSGFWVEDLPDPPGTAARRMGGEIFEVQQFRRAFFPLSPGDYEIPPARLSYEMRRGMLYAPETFEVASEPLPLTVLPVPEAGRPPEFTGAVGEYRLRAELEPSRVTAGEAVVLTVELEGVGNVKALPAPRLPELEGFEVFPPSEESSTEAVTGRMRGTKTFSWVLIPRESGAVDLPAVRYAYWDPDGRSFETLAAELPAVTVMPGNGSAIAESGTDASVRYLKTAPSDRGRRLSRWIASPGFAALQGVPLLVLLGAVVLRRRAGSTGPSRRALRQRRKAALRELRQRAENAADGTFFGDTEGFARSWLAEALGIRAGRASVPDALEGAGAEPRTASELARLLGRLSAARYAPTAPPAEERLRLVDALGTLLERVEREIRGPRGRSRPGRDQPGGRRGPGARRGPTSAALLVLAAGTAHAASPAAAAPAQEDAFRQGLAAFDQGRYHDAARVFDQWVGEHPRDPAGWYNLGTVYHHQEHEGFAAWAWLNALRLDPRDGDTRHNLQAAGVAPELLARVAPPVPLTREELIIAITLAWWVAALAGAWWLLRRRAAAAAVATVALVLGLAAAGAWAAGARATGTLVVLEETPLRAGPTLGGEMLTGLDPAAGLVPVAAYDEWLRVRTLDGREGWVEARSVAAL